MVIVGGILMKGCNSDDGSVDQVDNFDREAMLTNWADNIIIPSYEAYVKDLNFLGGIVLSFTDAPNVEGLIELRSAWLNAYISWQRVSMFEIGKAEELTLRNYTNVYPVNVEDMLQSIETGQYDLSSVNKQDEQGFPALDFLINGLDESDQAIVQAFQDENYQKYLIDLVARMYLLSEEVLINWKEGYRDSFVNSDGSDATSSVNKLVNDLVFYYEKSLRAGKIGIPAGVFSGAPLSDRVEALYSQGNSKVLFLTALQAFQDFINGVHFNSNDSGESLTSYMDFLNTIKEEGDLSLIINNQFDLIREAAEELDNDFEKQINSDNTKMLSTYDQLQVNVVNMKVDMMQALNIKVDFVDADGD